MEVRSYGGPAIMDGITLTVRQRRALERQLSETTDARLFRRTLAVLEVCHGVPVAEVARTLAVSRQSIYNWVETYQDSYDPKVLSDSPHPGRPSVWTCELQTLLDNLMQTQPDQLGYYAVNWTVPLLQHYLEDYTGERFSENTIRRELRRMKYVWKRSRYVLKPDPEAAKKNGEFGGK
jgi:transposase